jgi:hypothetical protein
MNPYESPQSQPDQPPDPIRSQIDPRLAKFTPHATEVQAILFIVFIVYVVIRNM